MTRVERARQLRPVLVTAVAGLDDKTASQAIEFAAVLDGNGALVPVNTRINWRGVLKRARVDLWDTPESDPDHAPELWEDVLYRDGIRVIPEHIPATDPFNYGDLGWWGEVLMRSIFEGVNTWTPEEYPTAWEVVNV